MAVSDSFTMKQLDAFEALAEAADAFLHAFGEDHKEEASKVEALMQELAEWAES